MRCFIIFLFVLFYNIDLIACSVCGGEYTEGEIAAYKGTTLFLLLLVVSMMGGFFYWAYKKYAYEN